MIQRRVCRLKKIVAASLVFTLLLTQVFTNPFLVHEALAAPARQPVDSHPSDFWKDRAKKIQSNLPQSSPILSSQSSTHEFESSDPKRFPVLNPLLQNVSKYLQVRDVHVGNADEPVVMLIQDIHMNVEAQRNIGQALAVMNQRSDSLVIGAEASAGAFDFNPFRYEPDLSVTKTIADYLLREKEIAAVSWFGLTATEPLPPVIGLETAKLYVDNVEAYKKLAKKQSSFLESVSEEKAELLKNGETLLSAESQALLAALDAYQAGRQTIQQYIETLSAKAPKVQTPNIDLFVRAAKMERSLNTDQTKRERDRILEKLSRSSRRMLDAVLSASLAYQAEKISAAAFYRELGILCDSAGIRIDAYPHFQTYVRYLELVDNIQQDLIFDELRALRDAAIASVSRTDKEKQFFQTWIQTSLQERLVKLELTPQEWREYVKTDRFKSFESFYAIAESRNEHMLSHLYEGLLRYQKKHAVIVAGGFHTPGLVDLLKKRNASVVVLTPKVTKIDDSEGSAYLNTFLRDRTPLAKLFTGEKLTLGVSEQNIGTTVLDRRFSTAAVDTRFLELRLLSNGGFTPEEIAHVQLPAEGLPGAVVVDAIDNNETVRFSMDGKEMEVGPAVPAAEGQTFHAITSDTPDVSWRKTNGWHWPRIELSPTKIALSLMALLPALSHAGEAGAPVVYAVSTQVMGVNLLAWPLVIFVLGAVVFPLAVVYLKKASIWENGQLHWKRLAGYYTLAAVVGVIFITTGLATFQGGTVLFRGLSASAAAFGNLLQTTLGGTTVGWSAFCVAILAAALPGKNKQRLRMWMFVPAFFVGAAHVALNDFGLSLVGFVAAMAAFTVLFVGARQRIIKSGGEFTPAAVLNHGASYLVFGGVALALPLWIYAFGSIVYLIAAPAILIGVLWLRARKAHLEFPQEYPTADSYKQPFKHTVKMILGAYFGAVLLGFIIDRIFSTSLFVLFPTAILLIVNPFFWVVLTTLYQDGWAGLYKIIWSKGKGVTDVLDVNPENQRWYHGWKLRNVWWHAVITVQLLFFLLLNLFLHPSYALESLQRRMDTDHPTNKLKELIKRIPADRRAAFFVNNRDYPSRNAFIERMNFEFGFNWTPAEMRDPVWCERFDRVMGELMLEARPLMPAPHAVSGVSVPTYPLGNGKTMTFHVHGVETGLMGDPAYRAQMRAIETQLAEQKRKVFTSEDLGWQLRNTPWQELSQETAYWTGTSALFQFSDVSDFYLRAMKRDQNLYGYARTRLGRTLLGWTMAVEPNLPYARSLDPDDDQAASYSYRTTWFAMVRHWITNYMETRFLRPLYEVYQLSDARSSVNGFFRPVWYEMTRRVQSHETEIRTREARLIEIAQRLDSKTISAEERATLLREDRLHRSRLRQIGYPEEVQAAAALVLLMRRYNWVDGKTTEADMFVPATLAPYVVALLPYPDVAEKILVSGERQNMNGNMRMFPRVYIPTAADFEKESKYNPAIKQALLTDRQIRKTDLADLFEQTVTRASGTRAAGVLGVPADVENATLIADVIVKNAKNVWGADWVKRLMTLAYYPKNASGTMPVEVLLGLSPYMDADDYQSLRTNPVACQRVVLLVSARMARTDQNATATKKKVKFPAGLGEEASVQLITRSANPDKKTEDFELDRILKRLQAIREAFDQFIAEQVSGGVDAATIAEFKKTRFLSFEDTLKESLENRVRARNGGFLSQPWSEILDWVDEKKGLARAPRHSPKVTQADVQVLNAYVNDIEPTIANLLAIIMETLHAVPAVNQSQTIDYLLGRHSVVPPLSDEMRGRLETARQQMERVRVFTKQFLPNEYRLTAEEAKHVPTISLVLTQLEGVPALEDLSALVPFGAFRVEKAPQPGLPSRVILHVSESLAPVLFYTLQNTELRGELQQQLNFERIWQGMDAAHLVNAPLAGGIERARIRRIENAKTRDVLMRLYRTRRVWITNDMKFFVKSATLATRPRNAADVEEERDRLRDEGETALWTPKEFQRFGFGFYHFVGSEQAQKEALFLIENANLIPEILDNPDIEMDQIDLYYRQKGSDLGFAGWDTRFLVRAWNALPQWCHNLWYDVRKNSYPWFGFRQVDDTLDNYEIYGGLERRSKRSGAQGRKYRSSDENESNQARREGKELQAKDTYSAPTLDWLAGQRALRNQFKGRDIEAYGRLRFDTEADLWEAERGSFKLPGVEARSSTNKLAGVSVTLPQERNLRKDERQAQPRQVNWLPFADGYAVEQNADIALATEEITRGGGNVVAPEGFLLKLGDRLPDLPGVRPDELPALTTLVSKLGVRPRGDVQAYYERSVTGWDGFWQRLMGYPVCQMIVGGFYNAGFTIGAQTYYFFRSVPWLQRTFKLYKLAHARRTAKNYGLDFAKGVHLPPLLEMDEEMHRDGAYSFERYLTLVYVLMVLDEAASNPSQPISAWVPDHMMSWAVWLTANPGEAHRLLAAIKSAAAANQDPFKISYRPKKGSIDDDTVTTSKVNLSPVGSARVDEILTDLPVGRRHARLMSVPAVHFDDYLVVSTIWNTFEDRNLDPAQEIRAVAYDLFDGSRRVTREVMLQRLLTQKNALPDNQRAKLLDKKNRWTAQGRRVVTYLENLAGLFYSPPTQLIANDPENRYAHILPTALFGLADRQNQLNQTLQLIEAGHGRILASDAIASQLHLDNNARLGDTKGVAYDDFVAWQSDLDSEPLRTYQQLRDWAGDEPRALFARFMNRPSTVNSDAGAQNVISIVSSFFSGLVSALSNETLYRQNGFHLNVGGWNSETVTIVHPLLEQFAAYVGGTVTRTGDTLKIDLKPSTFDRAWQAFAEQEFEERFNEQWSLLLRGRPDLSAYGEDAFEQLLEEIQRNKGQLPAWADLAINTAERLRNEPWGSTTHVFVDPRVAALLHRLLENPSQIEKLKKERGNYRPSPTRVDDRLKSTVTEQLKDTETRRARWMRLHQPASWFEKSPVGLVTLAQAAVILIALWGLVGPLMIGAQSVWDFGSLLNTVWGDLFANAVSVEGKSTVNAAFAFLAAPATARRWIGRRLEAVLARVLDMLTFLSASRVGIFVFGVTLATAVYVPVMLLTSFTMMQIMGAVGVVAGFGTILFATLVRRQDATFAGGPGRWTYFLIGIGLIGAGGGLWTFVSSAVAASSLFSPPMAVSALNSSSLLFAWAMPGPVLQSVAGGSTLAYALAMYYAARRASKPVLNLDGNGMFDLDDFGSVDGKRIFYRPDYNVSFKPDGSIKSNFRVRSTLSSWKRMLEGGVKQVVVGFHVGRPAELGDDLIKELKKTKLIQPEVRDELVRQIEARKNNPGELVDFMIDVTNRQAMDATLKNKLRTMIRIDAQEIAKELERLLKEEGLLRPEERVETPWEHGNLPHWDSMNADVKRFVDNSRARVVVLQNLRMTPEEAKGDAAFAAMLADGMDVIVNDGFGNNSKDGASNSAFPRNKPMVTGDLNEEEVKILNYFAEMPERPFMGVAGGSKLTEKINFVRKIISRLRSGEPFAIGGAMGHTVLIALAKAQGRALPKLGKSKGAQPDDLDATTLKNADDVIALCRSNGINLLTPIDAVDDLGVTWDLVDENNLVLEIPRRGQAGSYEYMSQDRSLLDIGPKTSAVVAAEIKKAKMGIFNGPFGYIEEEKWQNGTRAIVEAIFDKDSGQWVVGGGDSATAVEEFGFLDHERIKTKKVHVSTGGQTSMAILEGSVIPPLERLKRTQANAWWKYGNYKPVEESPLGNRTRFQHWWSHRLYPKTAARLVINGPGRTGRQDLLIALKNPAKYQVVAVNGLRKKDDDSDSGDLQLEEVSGLVESDELYKDFRDHKVTVLAAGRAWQDDNGAIEIKMNRRYGGTFAGSKPVGLHSDDGRYAADLFDRFQRHDQDWGRCWGDAENPEGQRKIEWLEIKSEATGRIHRVLFFNARDQFVRSLPWDALGAEGLVEAAGVALDSSSLAPHFQAGVKVATLGAPPTGDGIQTAILKVNDHEQYASTPESIMSNGSCTTNAVTQVAKVVADAFQLLGGFVITTHAVTQDQQIVYLPRSGEKETRGQPAEHILITKTGAAELIKKVIKSAGPHSGVAVRVPANVSLIEFVGDVKPTEGGIAVTVENVIRKFLIAAGITDKNIIAAYGVEAGIPDLQLKPDELREARQNEGNGILGVVSKRLGYSARDDVQNPNSATVNLAKIEVSKPDQDGIIKVKIIATYDNEWGFDNRTMEAAYLHVMSYRERRGVAGFVWDTLFKNNPRLRGHRFARNWGRPMKAVIPGEAKKKKNKGGNASNEFEYESLLNLTRNNPPLATLDHKATVAIRYNPNHKGDQAQSHKAMVMIWDLLTGQDPNFELGAIVGPSTSDEITSHVKAWAEPPGYPGLGKIKAIDLQTKPKLEFTLPDGTKRSIPILPLNGVKNDVWTANGIHCVIDITGEPGVADKHKKAGASTVVLGSLSDSGEPLSVFGANIEGSVVRALDNRVGAAFVLAAAMRDDMKGGVEVFWNRAYREQQPLPHFGDSNIGTSAPYGNATVADGTAIKAELQSALGSLGVSGSVIGNDIIVPSPIGSLVHLQGRSGRDLTVEMVVAQLQSKAVSLRALGVPVYVVKGRAISSGKLNGVNGFIINTDDIRIVDNRRWVVAAWWDSYMGDAIAAKSAAFAALRANGIALQPPVAKSAAAQEIVVTPAANVNTVVLPASVPTPVEPKTPTEPKRTGPSKSEQRAAAITAFEAKNLQGLSDQRPLIMANHKSIVTGATTVGRRVLRWVKGFYSNSMASALVAYLDEVRSDIVDTNAEVVVAPSLAGIGSLLENVDVITALEKTSLKRGVAVTPSMRIAGEKSETGAIDPKEIAALGADLIVVQSALLAGHRVLTPDIASRVAYAQQAGLEPVYIYHPNEALSPNDVLSMLRAAGVNTSNMAFVVRPSVNAALVARQLKSSAPKSKLLLTPGVHVSGVDVDGLYIDDPLVMSNAEQLGAMMASARGKNPAVVLALGNNLPDDPEKFIAQVDVLQKRKPSVHVTLVTSPLHLNNLGRTTTDNLRKHAGPIVIGAQDVDLDGPNGPQRFAQAGVGFVLLGHSEVFKRQQQALVEAQKRGIPNSPTVAELREQYDRYVSQQAAAAARYGLGVQIAIDPKNGSKEFNPEDFKRHLHDRLRWASIGAGLSVLIEDPINIGTGIAANDSQLREYESAVREVLNERYGERAQDVRITYGGSVTQRNAARFSGNGYTGLTVGGASLTASALIAIVRSYTKGNAPKQKPARPLSGDLESNNWEGALETAVDAVQRNQALVSQLAGIIAGLNSNRRREILYKLMEPSYIGAPEYSRRVVCRLILDQLGAKDELVASIDLKFIDNVPLETRVQTNSTAVEAAFEMAAALVARFYRDGKIPDSTTPKEAVKKLADQMDDFAEDVLLAIAKKINRRFVIMGSEGAVDGVASKLTRNKIVNDGATGGTVYFLLDPVEGTHAASTRNEGRSIDNGRLTASDAGAIVVIAEGALVSEVLEGQPILDAYTRTQAYGSDPDQLNPNRLVRTLMARSKRELADAQQQLPGVSEHLKSIMDWCEANHRSLIVRDENGHSLQIISDGTVMHALQVLAGRNPALSNGKWLFAPYLTDDERRSPACREWERFIPRSAAEVNLRDLVGYLDATAKTNEAFLKIMMAALLHNRGARANVQIYSNAAKNGLNQKDNFAGSGPVNFDKHGRRVNDKEWLESERRDAADIIGLKKTFTSEGRSSDATIAIAHVTDSGTGARGGQILPNDRVLVTGVILRTTPNGTAFYPEQRVIPMPKERLDAYEDEADGPSTGSRKPIIGRVTGGDLSPIFDEQGYANILAGDQDNSIAKMVKALLQRLFQAASPVYAYLMHLFNKDIKEMGISAVIDIMGNLSPHASAILVNAFAFDRVKAVVPQGTGLLARLEASYSIDSSNPDQASVEPFWLGGKTGLSLEQQVDEAVRVMKAKGAHGVKVLTYINVEWDKHWKGQLAFLKLVVKACHTYRLPLLTEQMTPSDDNSKMKLGLKAAEEKARAEIVSTNGSLSEAEIKKKLSRHQMYLAERRKWATWQARNVIESVRSFDEHDVADVTKAEFPGDIDLLSDEPATNIRLLDALIHMKISDGEFKDQGKLLSDVSNHLKGLGFQSDDVWRAVVMVSDILELDTKVGDRWWVLLSAGKDFRLFKRQLALVKNFARQKNGRTGQYRYRGSMGGRANWKEYFDQPQGREAAFLNDPTEKGGVGRLKTISAIIHSDPNKGVAMPTDDVDHSEENELQHAAFSSSAAVWTAALFMVLSIVALAVPLIWQAMGIDVALWRNATAIGVAVVSVFFSTVFFSLANDLSGESSNWLILRSEPGTLSRFFIENDKLTTIAGYDRGQIFAQSRMRNLRLWVQWLVAVHEWGGHKLFDTKREWFAVLLPALPLAFLLGMACLPAIPLSYARAGFLALLCVQMISTGNLSRVSEEESHDAYVKRLNDAAAAKARLHHYGVVSRASERNYKTVSIEATPADEYNKRLQEANSFQIRLHHDMKKLVKEQPLAHPQTDEEYLKRLIDANSAKMPLHHQKEIEAAERNAKVKTVGMLTEEQREVFEAERHSYRMPLHNVDAIHAAAEEGKRLQAKYEREKFLEDQKRIFQDSITGSERDPFWEEPLFRGLMVGVPVIIVAAIWNEAELSEWLVSIAITAGIGMLVSIPSHAIAHYFVDRYEEEYGMILNRRLDRSFVYFGIFVMWFGGFWGAVRFYQKMAIENGLLSGYFSHWLVAASIAWILATLITSLVHYEHNSNVDKLKRAARILKRDLTSVATDETVVRYASLVRKHSYLFGNLHTYSEVRRALRAWEERALNDFSVSNDALIERLQESLLRMIGEIDYVSFFDSVTTAPVDDDETDVQDMLAELKKQIAEAKSDVAVEFSIDMTKIGPALNIFTYAYPIARNTKITLTADSDLPTAKALKFKIAAVPTPESLVVLTAMIRIMVILAPQKSARLMPASARVNDHITVGYVADDRAQRREAAANELQQRQHAFHETVFFIGSVLVKYADLRRKPLKLEENKSRLTMNMLAKIDDLSPAEFEANMNDMSFRHFFTVLDIKFIKPLLGQDIPGLKEQIESVQKIRDKAVEDLGLNLKPSEIDTAFNAYSADPKNQTKREAYGNYLQTWQSVSGRFAVITTQTREIMTVSGLFKTVTSVLLWVGSLIGGLWAASQSPAQEAVSVKKASNQHNLDTRIAEALYQQQQNGGFSAEDRPIVARAMQATSVETARVADWRNFSPSNLWPVEQRSSDFIGSLLQNAAAEQVRRLMDSFAEAPSQEKLVALAKTVGVGNKLSGEKANADVQATTLSGYGRVFGVVLSIAALAAIIKAAESDTNVVSPITQVPAKGVRFDPNTTVLHYHLYDLEQAHIKFRNRKNKMAADTLEAEIRRLAGFVETGNVIITAGTDGTEQRWRERLKGLFWAYDIRVEEKSLNNVTFDEHWTADPWRVADMYGDVIAGRTLQSLPLDFGDRNRWNLPLLPDERYNNRKVEISIVNLLSGLILKNVEAHFLEGLRRLRAVGEKA